MWSDWFFNFGFGVPHHNYYILNETRSFVHIWEWLAPVFRLFSLLQSPTPYDVRTQSIKTSVVREKTNLMAMRREGGGKEDLGIVVDMYRSENCFVQGKQQRDRTYSEMNEQTDHKMQYSRPWWF